MYTIDSVAIQSVDDDDTEPKEVGDAIPNSVRQTWDKLCVTIKH
jgi:hypothetical protein